MFISASTEEDIMKKFGYVIAALAAIAVAAPSIASAETVVVRDGDHHHGARAEFREHREHRDHGWHEGMHRHHIDRMVIGKHRHHEG
jgi:Ni/Co efflux regulator RcnB